MKRMSEVLTGKDWWYLILTAAASIGFMLFFCDATSPLYPYVHGVDSSFFMMTGRMVADGKVPYLDFFDMKGPLIFFIEGLGQWLADGKTGIFLVQNLFFLCTTGLSYGIARQFVKEGPAFLIILLNLCVAAVTSSGGNFTEEFSLPPVLLCTLLAVRYVKRCKTAEEESGHPAGMYKRGNTQKSGNMREWVQNRVQGLCQLSETAHPPLYAAVYGFCFMYLALIRVTNAAFICGIVGSVLAVLVVGRKWRNLLWNMGGFLAGATVCFVPVAIYFLSQNAFGEMLYGTFEFPFLYSNDGIANRAYGTWMSILYYVGPALIGMLAGLIYGRKKTPYMGYMMAFSSFLLIISLNMGRTSTHYFTMTLPAYVTGLAMLGQILADRALRNSPWPLFLTAALLAVSGTAYMNYHGMTVAKITGNLKSIMEPEENREWVEWMRSQGDMIPDYERDLVWGYNIHPAWYFVNDIQPCNRYCAYQPTFVEMNPETEQEIYQMLDTLFPHWIVVPDEADVNLEYLRAVLEVRYELVSSGQNMNLYHLK